MTSSQVAREAGTWEQFQSNALTLWKTGAQASDPEFSSIPTGSSSCAGRTEALHQPRPLYW